MANQNKSVEHSEDEECLDNIQINGVKNETLEREVNEFPYEQNNPSASFSSKPSSCDKQYNESQNLSEDLLIKEDSDNE